MSLFRYDPPMGMIEGPAPVAVGGPVVCRTCGCRLQSPTISAENDADLNGAWRHFEGLPGRDARGCRVACVDLDHGMDGFVIS